jgi:diaminopimelate epimerase
MNNEDGCMRQGCGNSGMQIIDYLPNVTIHNAFRFTALCQLLVIKVINFITK